MKEDLTKFIIESAKSTEGCQRNWDYDYTIPQDHIDTIVTTAITMPTKQNLEFYSLVVSTDRDFNYNFYLRTFKDEIGFPNQGRNAQTNAPLLLLWFKNQEIQGGSGINIGVSAGATALVANMLGYKTGFCCCMEDKISSMLKKKGIYTKRITLALGVGMPDSTMPDRNFVKFPDKVKAFEKRIKNIKIYTI
jgi:hypothetical protein